MRIGKYELSRTNAGFALTNTQKAAQLEAQRKQKLGAAQRYFEQKLIDGLSGGHAFNSAKANERGITVGPLQIVGRHERKSADKSHNGASLPNFHADDWVHFSFVKAFPAETKLPPHEAPILQVKVCMLGVEIKQDNAGQMREVIRGKVTVDHEAMHLRYSMDVYEGSHGKEPFTSVHFSSILRRLAKDIRRNFEGLLRNGET